MCLVGVAWNIIRPVFLAILSKSTFKPFLTVDVIMPASIAKGMEFDCVGICDASAENFPDEEFLCRVLYVMITRPLHRLCIWHTGEISPLLS